MDWFEEGDGGAWEGKGYSHVALRQPKRGGRDDARVHAHQQGRLLGGRQRQVALGEGRRVRLVGLRGGGGVGDWAGARGEVSGAHATRTPAGPRSVQSMPRNLPGVDRYGAGRVVATLLHKSCTNKRERCGAPRLTLCAPCAAFARTCSTAAWNSDLDIFWSVGLICPRPATHNLSPAVPEKLPGPMDVIRPKRGPRRSGSLAGPCREHPCDAKVRRSGVGDGCGAQARR